MAIETQWGFSSTSGASSNPFTGSYGAPIQTGAGSTQQTQTTASRQLQSALGTIDKNSVNNKSEESPTLQEQYADDSIGAMDFLLENGYILDDSEEVLAEAQFSDDEWSDGQDLYQESGELFPNMDGADDRTNSWFSEEYPQGLVA